MASYRIKAPNGQTYQIDGPEGASQNDIQAEVARQHPDAIQVQAAQPQQAPTPAPATWMDRAKQLGQATVNTVAGLGQAVAAPLDAVTHAIGAGAGYAVQGAGHLASAVTGNQSYANTADKYGNALQHPVTIGGAIEQAAPTPQDFTGRAVRLTSQLAGAVIPASGMGAIQSAATDMAGITPAALRANAFTPAAPTILGRVANALGVGGNGQNTTAAKLVAQKLAEDHTTPGEAATQMQTATANGQPMMLADMGDNTRALAADIGRQPGVARDIGQNAVRDRQIGDNPLGKNTVPSQSERVQTAISRDLGPVTDPIAASQQLTEQARQAAAPLYKTFHDLPARTSDELESLINTPAGQTGLAHARVIAGNDRVDPLKLGFDLDAQGNTILTKTPSPQTIDYIKQGLDNALEHYRSDVTGKLNLDPLGNSIEGVRRNFVEEADRLYPKDYAAARGAYAGPASMKDALQDGTDALTWAPNKIRARMAGMGDAEKSQFWLGMRSQLSQKVSEKNYGINGVRDFMNGSTKEALAEAAGGQANIENFMQSLEREQKMNVTYGKVTGGSSTFGNALENQSNNAALADNAIGHFGNGGTGKGFLLNMAVNQARGALRYGVGEAGKRAREDAASLLFTSSPNDFMKSLNQANTSTQVANRVGTNALLNTGMTAAKVAAARQSANTSIQADATRP